MDAAEAPRSFVLSPSHVLAVLRQGCKSVARNPVNCDYATHPQRHPKIPEWRDKLVEWMQWLGAEHRFSAVSIEVAVNYLDRLLSTVAVETNMLQTAALACILIATKQHETHSLPLSAVAKIAAADTLTRMELNVIDALKWDVNSFTAIQFVECVTALITDQDIATLVGSTAMGLLTSVAIREYALLRYSTCDVGLAALSSACAAHNFDYMGLATSLKANTIDVELRPELVQWFNETRDRQQAAALVRQGSPMPGQRRAAAASPAPSTLTARSWCMSPDQLDAHSVSGSDFEERARSALGNRHPLLGAAEHAVVTRARSATETGGRSSPGPMLGVRPSTAPAPGGAASAGVAAGGMHAGGAAAAPVAVRGTVAAASGQWQQKAAAAAGGSAAAATAKAGQWQQQQAQSLDDTLSSDEGMGCTPGGSSSSSSSSSGLGLSLTAGQQDSLYEATGGWDEGDEEGEGEDEDGDGYMAGSISRMASFRSNAASALGLGVLAALDE